MRCSSRIFFDVKKNPYFLHFCSIHLKCFQIKCKFKNLYCIFLPFGSFCFVTIKDLIKKRNDKFDRNSTHPVACLKLLRRLPMDLFNYLCVVKKLVNSCNVLLLPEGLFITGNNRAGENLQAGKDIRAYVYSPHRHKLKHTQKRVVVLHNKCT